MLNDFIKKLKNGYFKHGGTWEFDWYINCFFVDVMAYGNYPVKLGYMQAIVGDEFLTFKYQDNILSAFKGFFEDAGKVEKLISDQVNIISSSEELISAIKNGEFDFDKYEQIQKDLSLLMASVSVVFDPLISKQVSNMSYKLGVSEENLINFIVTNSNLTKLNESNSKLLNIYANNKRTLDNARYVFEKLDNSLKLLFTKHAENFGWINTGEKGSKEWTEVDFLKQLQNLVNRKRSIELSPSILNNNIDLKNIIRINQNDNIAADKQVELDFLFQNILKTKLGKYYIGGIIENITFDEIKQLYYKPELVSNFGDRKDNNMRIVWPENYKLNFCYFNDEVEYKGVIDQIQNQQSKSTEIKGSVASIGKVEGIVRIVRNQKDINDFPKGFVMVAEKTQPKYVTAMNRAIAIVTDMGGITSHAAIISREFGIPCIVGTKNATQLLKNGDKILVDAIDGKVTKI